jgi:membrane-bound lytic murein transglycosylase MltF
MNTQSYSFTSGNTSLIQTKAKISKAKTLKKRRFGLKIYHPTTDMQRRDLLHKVIDGHMTIHEVKIRNLSN